MADLLEELRQTKRKLVDAENENVCCGARKGVRMGASAGADVYECACCSRVLPRGRVGCGMTTTPHTHLRSCGEVYAAEMGVGGSSSSRIRNS